MKIYPGGINILILEEYDDQDRWLAGVPADDCEVFQDALAEHGAIRRERRKARAIVLLQQ